MFVSVRTAQSCPSQSFLISADLAFWRFAASLLLSFHCSGLSSAAASLLQPHASPTVRLSLVRTPRPATGVSWALRARSSAPRMTGRRSHWTERGDDNIFLRLAIVVRLFLLWLRMGSRSWHPPCVSSLFPSAEESWEEMTKIESRNKMLYSPGSDR